MMIPDLDAEAKRALRRADALARLIEHPATQPAERAVAIAALARVQALIPPDAEPEPEPPQPGPTPDWSWVCSWIRDPARPWDQRAWAVQGPAGVVRVGATVTVERRDGGRSRKRITRLGGFDRFGQIGYTR
jgi:hypothetical protein